MGRRYQETYPSRPLLSSVDTGTPSAAQLLTLEYFEAPPGEMPVERYVQHHVLLNLREEPHRVENMRDGVHRDFEFRRGEVVVTPAGVASGWRWHARSKVIVITLEPDALARFALGELGVVLTAEQLADEPQFLDEELCAAGELLLEALRSRGIGWELVLESLARVFLVKLIHRHGSRHELDAGSSSLTPERVRDLVEYVERNLEREITVDELAQQAHLSRDHFSRVFKEVVGEPPHQFVLTLRVERAKALLRDRSLTLSQIALKAGFSDQAHFSRVFKKRTTVTPGAFRKGLPG